MKKHPRSAGALLALVVILLLSIPTNAAAQTRAAARSAAMPTTSGTWGAAAVPQGAAALAGAPHVLTFPGWTSSAAEYFDLVNVGTLPISAQDIAISSVETWFGGGSRSPQLTMVACTGGSWNRSGRCAGKEVSLGSTSSGSFASSLTLQPGERVGVKLVIDWAWTGIRSTINVSVSRAQAREPILINS